MSNPNWAVRIVAVPPGEAPLWVRQKWVGLDLPVVRYAAHRKLPAMPSRQHLPSVSSPK
jgi:hypothetical protein